MSWTTCQKELLRTKQRLAKAELDLKFEKDQVRVLSNRKTLVKSQNPNHIDLITVHINKEVFRKVKLVPPHLKYETALYCMQTLTSGPPLDHPEIQREWATLYKNIVSEAIGKERGRVGSNMKSVCKAYYAKWQTLPTAAEMKAAILREFDPADAHMCHIFDWYISALLPSCIRKDGWCALHFVTHMVSAATFESIIEGSSVTKKPLITVQDEAYCLVTLENRGDLWKDQFSTPPPSQQVAASPSTAGDIHDILPGAKHPDKKKRKRNKDGLYTSCSSGRNISGWNSTGMNTFVRYYKHLEVMRADGSYKEIESQSVARLCSRYGSSLRNSKGNLHMTTIQAEEPLSAEDQFTNDALGDILKFAYI